MTAIGGRDTSDAIDRSAALLGYEASKPEPPVGTVGFVDYPFTADETDADRLDMLVAAVEKHQPQIATAPDVESSIDLDTAVTAGDRLLDAGAENVIIVPKDVHPSEVPERFRVGFPLADLGSGVSHGITAYADVPDEQGVHLLGGSPTVQFEIAGYGVSVDSVDGSGVQLGASKGDIWTPDAPHWEKAPGTDLYDRIRTSLTNIAVTWADYYGDWKPALGRVVSGAELGDRNDAIDSEVRRRNAGRGPPVADPDTGAVDETIDAPGVDLNERDREVSAAIERLAEADDPDAVEIEPDERPTNYAIELDDEQETLS